MARGQFFFVGTTVFELNCFFEFCRLVVLLVEVVQTLFFGIFHLLSLHLVSNIGIFFIISAGGVGTHIHMSLGRSIGEFHIGGLIRTIAVISVVIVGPSTHNEYIYIADESPSTIKKSITQLFNDLENIDPLSNINYSSKRESIDRKHFWYLNERITVVFVSYT